MIVEYSLLLLLLHLCLKRCPECMLPFLILILFLAPTAISSSLQFSGVYIISLCFSIAILYRWEFAEKDILIFCLVGALTSFVDFLTAPTLTLTIPLCFLCVQLTQREKQAKSAIKLTLLCAASWFTGYVGMWAGKWVIAGVYEGSEFWKTLIYSFSFRASATTSQWESISRTSVLLKNFKCLFDNPHLICLSVITLLATPIFSYKKHAFFSWEKIPMFFTPVSVPILWNLVTTNHSGIHYWFTYRTLAPCVFGVLTAISMACASPETN